MMVLLFSFLTITPCFSMQTPIRFCDEINNKMQRNITHITEEIYKRRFQNNTFKIYAQLGLELKTTAFFIYPEHQEIETVLNVLYKRIFNDLAAIYSIKSSLKEVSYDELKKDGKRLIIAEIKKQTTICFPNEEPDETDFYFIKDFLSKNKNLLSSNCKMALHSTPTQFSLVGNNDSRDLKLTIFAFAYLDQLLEQILTRANQKKSNIQLFYSRTLL